VGSGGKASIGFTVLNADLEKTKKTLAPLVADLGATLSETGKVSKVSVVGAGMRAVSGVAERMFESLATDGVNMKMITTGDIKISVLVEEDDSDIGAHPPGFETDVPTEPIKKAHLESRKAIRGRKALRSIHAAFRLADARKGAGVPPDQGGNNFKPRPNPLVVAGVADRRAAIARLGGMEDVLVSGVHLNVEQSRVTIHDLPDKPGNCSRVFNAVATGGILVDMIVQNLTGPEKAELSFTVPRSELTRALKRTQDVVQQIDTACRVVGDADIAVLFVFGVGMRTHTGVARTMFGALAARGINIGMINTSEVCVGVVVEKSRGDEALTCLKEAFKLA
jgi:aspartate kinase